ncbi:MAG TPA: amidohydrolase family protein [Acidimicrobiia bacterium]|nr:amidohydrolase family protein [Acidimicrobiia bacterium]
MADRRLLQGGTVLSLDPKVGNFEKGDLLIEGSKIAAVGPEIHADDAEIIDASNTIVMPGFVDTHRHLWEGILRNIGTDVPLEGDVSYLAFILNVLAPVYRPEDVYIANLVSAYGALDAGITTILDWSHIQTTTEHTDATVEALRASGMRAVFAYGNPWWKFPEEDQDDWFRDAASRYFSSKDQLLTLGYAPPGPEFTPFEIAQGHWELAREVGAHLTVHVGVGSFGKNDKVGEMGRAGLLGPDTTYIHCTTLSDDEVQIIVDTGGTFSLACPVEMMMGHGMPPTQKFLDRGLAPSLSVDVETNVPGDMFTQMRSALSLQHALIFDQQLSGAQEVPATATSRDAISWATIEGARANALEDKVGSLTPGKEADVIMLRTDRINVLPVNDPIGAVVWGMDTSNVDSVWVAGDAKKRDGELVGVDVTSVGRKATESRDYVVQTSGFALPQI